MKKGFEPINAADMKRLRVDKNKTGFTLWIKEPNDIERWLLDASCLKEDGFINMGQKEDNYFYRAVYDKDSNQIQILKRKQP